MLIKNFKKLATTPERKLALEVANAGLEAIDPEKILQQNVVLNGDVLTIKNERFNLKEINDIYVIGIGKAAFVSGQALEKILGPKITAGAILDIHKGKLKHLKAYQGTHPLPSGKNLKATEEILKIAFRAKKDDLIINLISGGASALFCAPKKLSLKEVQQLTDQLLKSGADIYEINTIRKHISRVKGGGLAKIEYPAHVISIIFSDVPGNDLSFIASGPTVLDTTTKQDAQRIANKYNIEDIVFYETPKDKKYFDNVSNILLLSGKTAIEAMEKKCQELKIPSAIYSYALRGEARIVGRKILQRLPKTGIMLASGETTVTVEGSGKGGRNQELVLGALPYLENTVFISVASDGHDNTEAAGAVGDGNSLSRAQKMGLNWREFIDNNDSFHFFEKLGDLIITGPTGSNVSDLIVILRSPTS